MELLQWLAAQSSTGDAVGSLGAFPMGLGTDGSTAPHHQPGFAPHSSSSALGSPMRVRPHWRPSPTAVCSCRRASTPPTAPSTMSSSVGSPPPERQVLGGGKKSPAEIFGEILSKSQHVNVSSQQAPVGWKGLCCGEESGAGMLTDPPPESSAHSLPTVLIHVHSSWNKGWCSAGGLSPLSPFHFCTTPLPGFPIAGNSI